MKKALVLIMTFLSIKTATASLIAVESYDMLNGDVGSYAYWDETYNGTGDVTVSRSRLTGGTGDLTDGIIASGWWGAVEPGNGILGAVGGDNGPYVGWVNYNPFITFNFGQVFNITKAIVYVDNSINTGGVGGPRGVSFNGMPELLNPIARANATTAILTFDLNITSDQITAEIFRTNSWVFISEVQFEGTAVDVPAPETFAILLMGMVGLFFSHRKQIK
ncbi:hypothetical protein [Alteromonas flava]|uniref:hypothetical protein n=1 Tax=Alteromonas flava TaxID=2048003 RepID=UPI000C28770B|nr:hypothetical protein [Alteromonas flava]